MIFTSIKLKPFEVGSEIGNLDCMRNVHSSSLISQRTSKSQNTFFMVHFTVILYAKLMVWVQLLIFLLALVIMNSNYQEHEFKIIFPSKLSCFLQVSSRFKSAHFSTRFLIKTYLTLLVFIM